METNSKRNQVIIPIEKIFEEISTATLMRELYKRCNKDIDKFVAGYTIASYCFYRNNGKIKTPAIFGTEGGIKKFEELFKILEKAPEE